MSLVTSAHAILLGCSVCARGETPGVALLVAAMLGVPYAVTALVVRAIRRAAASDRARQGPG